MPVPVVETDNDQIKLPPPSGDSQRAEKYINELVPLLSQGKLTVEHTDLSKYDPSSLHDHYRIDMQSYQLEISHSKQPLTGKDSYVLLFNNLKNIEQGYSEKVILAYLILTADQFKKLQDVADEQIETRKKIEEEKRFALAMSDVDLLLDKIAKGAVDVHKEAQPLPEIEAKSEITVPEPDKPEKLEKPAEIAAVERPTPPPAQPATAPTAPINQSVLATMEQQADQEEQKKPDQPSAQQPPQPVEKKVVIPSLEGYNLPGVNTNSTPAAGSVPLEQVQNILHQTAQDAQPAAETKPVESLPTIDNLPAAQNPTPSGAGIDQAIDQAFKPADNSVLHNPPVPNS